MDLRQSAPIVRFRVDSFQMIDVPNFTAFANLLSAAQRQYLPRYPSMRAQCPQRDRQSGYEMSAKRGSLPDLTAAQSSLLYFRRK
jgi:hypothetical protein